MMGYSIVLIPRSWAIGTWYKKNKIIFAFGPLRFAIHYGLGPWKPKEFTPNRARGVWLHGPSPSDRLTDHDRTPAGGALEPVNHRTEHEREGFHGGARSGPLGFDG